MFVIKLCARTYQLQHDYKDYKEHTTIKMKYDCLHRLNICLCCIRSVSRCCLTYAEFEIEKKAYASFIVLFPFSV